MYGKEALVGNLRRLIIGANALSLPVICTEQYPEKLGDTESEISELFDNSALISKLSFSCWGELDFRNEVKSTNRQQVIVAGIEAHVCVFQTSADLVENGFETYVVADAVSSRSKANREIALRRIASGGAIITSTEMALLEMVRIAKGESFKKIISILR